MTTTVDEVREMNGDYDSPLILLYFVFAYLCTMTMTLIEELFLMIYNVYSLFSFVLARSSASTDGHTQWIIEMLRRI